MCNDKPLISIITVVLNNVNTIEKTILSVLCQDYDRLEYIIIDGGSTDGTKRILKQYEDKICYWCSEPDKGISDAFNKGISHCNGKYIGLINADDWYEPAAIKNLVKYIGQADIIYGKAEYWKNCKSLGIWDTTHTLLEKEMTLTHASVFVTKSLYDRFSTFCGEYRFAMDYELMLRFKSKGASFYKIDEKLSNVSLEGASDKNWLKAYYEVVKIKQAVLGQKYFPFIYFCKQVVRRIIREALFSLGLKNWVAKYRQHFSLLKKL